jgi:sarcosine oxidase subunit beta
MADFDTETVSATVSEPPKQPDPRALLCLCEDVRVGDCEQAIADGFDNIELLKRRTGAGTGPCQGKLCHAELMACLARRDDCRPYRRSGHCCGRFGLMRSQERTMAVDRADVVIIGGGIAGLALAWELCRRASRRIVVLERRFSGYGSSMRNIGRVRAMQLTPELAEIAIAAQAKHAGLSRELGRSTLFWRAGYALVLYEPDELEFMRGVQRMLRGMGLKTELVQGGRNPRSAADP